MAINIVDKARALESRIAKALSQAAENAVGSTSRQPLEVLHAIIDVVEREIQSGGRGQRLFPFDLVAVVVLAPSRDVRAHFEALFTASPSLQDRLIERLRSRGCDISDLRVDLHYASRAARNWVHPQFHVTFDRLASQPVAASVEISPSRIELAVVRGVTEPPIYTAAVTRLDLGRGREVRDQRSRLLRTNQVIFTEGEKGENETVSRCHAHVVFDAATGDYRLHDDGSAHGTGIVRGGRTIPVPPGARGVRLRSGDEIVLGEARLRFRIGETA
jgi:FHA domain